MRWLISKGTPVASRLARLWRGPQPIDRLQLITALLAVSLSIAFCLSLAYLDRVSAGARASKLDIENRSLSHALAQYAGAAFQLVDHTLMQSRAEWLEARKLRDHRDYYQTFPNFKDMILQVAIIDSNGMLMGTSIDPKAKPVFLGDREHYLAHIGGKGDDLFVGKPLIGRVSKRPSVQFSRPIFLPEGSFGGVIVASVDPSFLDHFFKSPELDGRISFGLAGNDGLPRTWSGDIPLRLPVGFQARQQSSGQSYTTEATADAPAAAWYAERLKNVPLAVVVATNRSRLDEVARTESRWRMGLAAAFLLCLNGAALYGIRILRSRNRALFRLRESRSKANSASRMKSRFVADISHELRTPLNGILGFSDLVSRSTDLAKAVTYGKLINSSAIHLHRIVNTLLDLAKIEAGRMSVTPTRFNLREVCESVVGIHQWAADDKGIFLRVSFGADVPEFISTDRIKLMQILNNITHNAVKFTDSGEVDMKVAYDGDNWVFRVSDTGAGMSAKEVEQLFSRFSYSSLHSHTMLEGQGSGLGMALCKELTQLLGGQVAVLSEPGMGTLIEITLPLREEETV